MIKKRLFDGNSWVKDWNNAITFSNEIESLGYHLMSIQPYAGGMTSAGIVVIYREKK